MDAQELKARTQTFGLRTLQLVDSLPKTAVARTIGNQLLRSGTSVGANYRAACRGRSRPDFISKVGIAIEEADESLYWLEILVEAGILEVDVSRPLMQEGNELIAIPTASVKTAKAALRSKTT